VVTSGGKVSLVGGDAEAVDLGVRMLDCARTDTRQSLPESNNKESAYGKLLTEKRIASNLIV
jgi:hypothetical protein